MTLAAKKEQSDNLKKGKATQFKSGEKAAEAGRKGGIASGKAKREKKLLKDCFDELLSRDWENKNGQKSTGAEAITLTMFKKALAGDPKAFEIVRDTAGQKPVERVMLAEVDQKTINEVEAMVLGEDNADKKTGG
jgi:hypothetical protein